MIWRNRAKTSNTVSHLYLLSLGFKKLAAKVECGPNHTDKGYKKTAYDCAKACAGTASMFIYGTNSFGTKRCNSKGCRCWCEHGTRSFCQKKRHTGYNLYVTHSNDKSKFWYKLSLRVTNYSEICLKRTPWGPTFSSTLDRCPL